MRNSSFSIPILCVALCAAAGCEPGIQEYRAPAESPDYESTEVLRAQFQEIPFNWSVPKHWTEAQNDQFSEFAWNDPTADGDVRITISILGAQAGLESQFLRWRGQIGLPEVPLSDAMKDVEELSLNGLDGRWVRYEGESETILGMIVLHRDRMWVFKLRAANADAEKARKAFREFCESVEAPTTE